MSGLHAPLAPSDAHRWIGCPGSLQFCAGIPEGPSSVYADEGTFAHNIAAECLKKGLDAEQCLGKTSNDGRFTVDDEMVAAVQDYLDVVRALYAPGFTLLVESKVKLESVHLDIYGTADAVIIGDGGTRVDVVDFKFGAGVFVPVEENPQLRIYALGAILTHATKCAKVETVGIHIVQPRHHKGGHHEETLTKAELMEWGNTTLREAAKRTEDPAAPLRAGDHCRFCDGKTLCPEIQNKALRGAQEVFGSVDNMSTPAKVQKPLEMTPKRLREILDAAPLVEDWLSAVKEFAVDFMKKGGTIPGYKLIKKEGNRAWKNPDLAPLDLALLLDDPKTIWADPKLRSPAQVEKLLPKEKRSKVAALTVRPDRGVALAPASNPKPAVVVGEVFEALPEKAKKKKSEKGKKNNG